MIFYNSALAKFFLNENKDSFMALGINFIKRRHPNPEQEMRMLIKEKQYQECLIITFPIALILSLFISWWFMLLPLIAYHLFYTIEWGIRALQPNSSFTTDFVPHKGCTAFDCEVNRHCIDLVYFRKRKCFAWTKFYFKTSRPVL